MDRYIMQLTELLAESQKKKLNYKVRKEKYKSAQKRGINFE